MMRNPTSKHRQLTLADIANIGPNTAAGEWFRRYWIVVSRAEDLKNIPLGVKILGEELVLFRDDMGRPGLLGLHCSHRGTSLEYGDIECGGLRCPYHGWLYDIGGNCLEQPAEPPKSQFYKKIKHLSYPVRELGGLIWTYMGPDKEDPPPLPQYSALVRQDGFRAIPPPRYYEYSWFNFFENAPDIAHASILHTSGAGHATRTWGDNFFNRVNVPPFDVVETDYGIEIISHKPGPEAGTKYVHIMSVALPAIVQVTGRTEDESNDERTLFITPTDNDHFTVFSADFHAGSDPNFLVERQNLRVREPREQELLVYDQRKYMPFRGQVWKEDIVCQSTQGAIGNRRPERLGDSDRGVILLRKIVLQAIETARRGRRPKGVLSKGEPTEIKRLKSFIGVMTDPQLTQELSGNLSR
jgi:phenylpropionate dioxygenase-like ring-hydroxylating dioxygenase large terminal subunit